MNAALAAVALAPGLAVGSFLNVLAARLPLRRSVVKPRSACMSCGSQLAWYDNVPLLSYVLLRGRCRLCGVAISALYPAVEVATAMLLAACVWRFGLTGQTAVAVFFCAVLVAVTATDLTHRIVPNRIVVPAAALVVLAQTALEPRPEWALSAFAAAAFLLAAAVAYPAGMGMGDVKLALLMGAALGKAVAVALFGAMIFALVPTAFLVARHGPAARKMGIPFAPFLALGSVLALFYGHELLQAYWALFMR